MSTRNRRGSGHLIGHLIVLVLAGLLALLIPGPGASARTEPMPTYTWTAKPSPLYILRPGADLPVSPYTWCWSGPSIDGSPSTGSCADGHRPALRDLTSTWSQGRRNLWFGRPGWRFTARSTMLHSCIVMTKALRVTRIAPRRFVLQTPPESGDYRIDMHGTGPEGDVTLSFVWHYRTTAPVVGGCGPTT